VLISSQDFFDAHSGLSLPLAVQLRGKFISEMKRRGARVLLPGSNEDQYLILQGSWQGEGEFLALDLKIIALGQDGPEAVAAASAKLLKKRLDENALIADLDSWGRYLLRKLELQVRNRQRRSVYLRAFQIKGNLREKGDLGIYLNDWLRPALAENNLFRVLDPQHELCRLDVEQLRTRGGLPQNRRAGPETDSDLTADLIRADTELWGSAWSNRRQLEIRISILDPGGIQISAASATVPENLFPDYLVDREGQAKGLVAAGELDSEQVSLGGLRVELSSNRGDHRPRYYQGEQIRFLVRLNRPAWVYLFYLNPDGSAVLLYPLDRRQRFDSQAPPLKANHLLVLPDDGCPYDLKVSPPFGVDRVLAIAGENRLTPPPGELLDQESAAQFFADLRRAATDAHTGHAEARLELITLAKPVSVR